MTEKQDLQTDKKQSKPNSKQSEKLDEQQQNLSPNQLSNPQATSSLPTPSLENLSPEQIEQLHIQVQEKEKSECFEAIKIVLDKFGYELIPFHAFAGGQIVEAKVILEKRMQNPGG